MIKLVNPNEIDIAGAILNVQQLAYLQESLLVNYPDLPPLKETLEDIQISKEIFLGYDDAEMLVGVLSYTITSNKLTIQRLVVHPTHARKGIGQALLKKVLEQPHIQTFIVSTAEKNSPAINLYEKHGFRIARRHTTQDGLVIVNLEKLNVLP